jgi:hypothetical protein
MLPGPAQAGRYVQERLSEADRRRGAVTIMEQSDEPASAILRYENRTTST